MTNEKLTEEQSSERLQPGPMFIALANLRNAETQLRWTRAQLFLLLHSPALAAVIPIVFGPTWTRETSHVIVTASILGFILGIIWLIAAHRAEAWIDFWNKRFKAIEANAPPVVLIFTLEKFDDLNQHIFSFHRLALVLPGIAIIAWSAIFYTVEYHPPALVETPSATTQSKPVTPQPKSAQPRR